ncbi:hypothetical protein B0H14DRAFT_3526599 [Mycena olivaceomarginata]|nr:hypothetical protein B0H14DRAFT_3526599 [Mycena olivaceomarginata]
MAQGSYGLDWLNNDELPRLPVHVRDIRTKGACGTRSDDLVTTLVPLPLSHGLLRGDDVHSCSTFRSPHALHRLGSFCLPTPDLKAFNKI